MSDLISRKDALKAIGIGALSAATVYGRSEAGMEAKREIERAIADLPAAQPVINVTLDEEKVADLIEYRKKIQERRNVPNDDSISRKAAIDIASGYCHPANIAKELAALPSVHPKFPENWWKTDHGYMWLCPHCGLPVHSDFDECLRCGIKRPSAQPEQKKGKWIEQDDGWDGVYYECSVCKEAFTLIDGTPSDNLYNFCPNCGARMEGEQ